MKILRIIPSLDALDGGPTTAAIGMSTALARAGADVTQVTTVRREETSLPDGAAVEDNGVTYRRFRRSFPGTYKYSRGLGQWVRAHTAGFDIVHVEALFSYTTIPGCRSAMRERVPYVLAPLGSLNEWSQRHHAWKKRPYYSLIERKHLEGAAALHANSRSEAEALVKAGFGDKTRIIPLGVDVPEAVAPRKPNDVFHIVFLSRLHPIKGLPLLFEAVAGARSDGVPVRLTVAGGGDAAYESELRSLAASLGIAQYVSFVGHVAGREKDMLFKSADLFALTSYQESFGLAILEAMAYGIPVLVTDRGGIVDDVRRAGAGEVVATDVTEIRTALLGLTRSPARLRELGKAARELAMRSYSWDHTAAGLLELYEEIVGRRGTRLPDRAVSAAR